MRHSRGERAFSLVELLLAVGIGTMTVAIAFVGFRVASQTSVVANRLSLENSLMRAGVVAAHEELDFWRQYDDPDDPARQALRVISSGKGQPFTPLAAIAPTSTDGNPEHEIGWNADAAAWAAHNPRAWQRVNLAEKYSTDLRFGRYGIFSNAAFVPTCKDLAIDWGLARYPALPVPHSWLGNQINLLNAALGYYGMCEYLPANALYVTYDSGSSSGSLTLGGIPTAWITPQQGFCNSDGWQRDARGKYRQTYMTTYAIMNPACETDALLLTGDHRRCWAVGYNYSDMGAFIQRTDGRMPLLPRGQPKHWPIVTMSVARFMKNTRSVNVCRVRMASPLTGQAVEINFTGFGTTLRGARQQRNPAGGWAKWDDKPGSVNDTTLDN